MRDGQTNEQLKIELLSQWKLEAEFRKIPFSDLEPIFTMKGCTDKDAILDFFVANDFNFDIY